MSQVVEIMIVGIPPMVDHLTAKARGLFDVVAEDEVKGEAAIMRTLMINPHCRQVNKIKVLVQPKPGNGEIINGTFARLADIAEEIKTERKLANLMEMNGLAGEMIEAQTQALKRMKVEIDALRGLVAELRKLATERKDLATVSLIDTWSLKEPQE